MTNNYLSNCIEAPWQPMVVKTSTFFKKWENLVITCEKIPILSSLILFLVIFPSVLLCSHFSSSPW